MVTGFSTSITAGISKGAAITESARTSDVEFDIRIMDSLGERPRYTTASLLRPFLKVEIGIEMNHVVATFLFWTTAEGEESEGFEVHIDGCRST